MVDFEIATKNKYRFPFKGAITVEDLWDLSCDQLNSVFKTLNKEKKTVNEESLMDMRQSAEDVVLTNKIDIVKYIFNAKQMEIQEKRAAADKHARDQLIMGLIKEKENESLKSLSIEELKKLLDA